MYCYELAQKSLVGIVTVLLEYIDCLLFPMILPIIVLTLLVTYYVFINYASIIGWGLLNFAGYFPPF